MLWRLQARQFLAVADVAQAAQRSAVGVAAWQRRRGFATTAITVPERGSAPEQTLFVVGLNKRKFFGQDGAEEGLKLLERIAEHNAEYQLLFGLTEKELAEIEAEYKVKHRKLTPSRELEGVNHCEVIPIVQAGMVDNRPRRALDRELRITQSHVAWLLWQHPREAVKGYLAYWQLSKHVDAERCRFWSEQFPICANAYFEERAELVAIRAVETLIIERVQGRKGTTVLIVNNELFGLVQERLKMILDVDAPEKLGASDFRKALRDRGNELCLLVLDLTPVLLGIYVGLPLLLLHQGALFIEYLFTVPRDGEIAYDIETKRE